MNKAFQYPRKLFTLMMLCFIGFSGLLLLISGIVYYGTYSELAYREIRATKEELLDETSQKLSNYVKGIQDTALFLVTNKMVQQHLSNPPESFYDYVSRSRDLHEQFQKLVTVKDGVLSIELYSDWIGNYPPIQDAFMHRTANAAEEGWLERMKQSDGIWITAHNYSQGDREHRAVSYAHRIFGIHGETLGIVKINIPERKLFSLLERSDQPPDIPNYYVIMDSRANYIASSLPEGIAARDSAEEMINEVAGTRYSVIQSDLNPQSWMLLQLISKDVLHQNSNDIRTLIIALLSALLVLSIPLAFWVTRKLTAPIYSIVEGMHAVEKGDFTVRMGSSGIQEYLYLTTHFNRMVYRLKDLIDRLNQEHRDRRKAEIRLLHAQIKPHFLYNTLDLIHWRALDHNAPEISRMVQQLSKLFRIGLGNDKWYATVRDELMHARCYMTIQAYRHSYPIDYEEQVESELQDALVPKIILQPFLENAVVHGFRHWSGQAVIRTIIRRAAAEGGARLTVVMTDNGRGLPDGFDASQAGGIGIRNVIERIQLYCGMKYGVQIARGAEGGTQVTITLPLIHHEEDMDQLTRSFADEYDSVGG